MRITSLGLFLFVLAPATVVAQDNPILSRAAAEDQAARRGPGPIEHDDERLSAVLHQLAADGVRTAQDQLNAAIVLQHSPLVVRDGRIVALEPANYLMAHLLAKAAFAEKPEAGTLVAQTIDRYLTFTTGVQRYGTNRLINQVTGAEELVPIDRATTDAERAIYGVQPLESLLKQFPEAVRSTCRTNGVPRASPENCRGSRG
jgi:hypothetical protein